MSQDIGGSQTTEGGKAQLAEKIAGTFGTGAILHLYLAVFSPVKSNVKADFVAAEPTYIGYLAVALTWGVVGVDSAGNGLVRAIRALFTNTGIPPTDPSQVIGGVWLEDQTAVGPPEAGTVSRYYPFTVPVVLAAGGGQMSVEVVVTDNGTGYAIVD